MMSSIALFTHFIACGVWEAVYILDGLLKNTSDIQPDTLHADTQGQSAPVFALSYLLGIKLMPRIRNWHDFTFSRPTSDTVYKYIDPLFKGIVDWKLVITENDPLEQEKRVKYLDLVASVVILQNTFDISFNGVVALFLPYLGSIPYTLDLDSTGTISSTSFSERRTIVNGDRIPTCSGVNTRCKSSMLVIGLP